MALLWSGVLAIIKAGCSKAQGDIPNKGRGWFSFLIPLPNSHSWCAQTSPALGKNNRKKESDFTEKLGEKKTFCQILLEKMVI